MDFKALMNTSEYDFLQSLPEEIKKNIEGKEYTIDDMGKSGSKVLIFEDMVLKITDKPCDDKDAVEMMRWLEGKIPAPQVIVFEEDDSYSYLLMTRVRGKIACDKYYLERPKELVPLLKKRAGKLSGGQKRRLTIACALLGDQRILIMDEPTSALDVGQKEIIHRYIKDFTAQKGVVIMATHDIIEMELCDRLYHLSEHRLTEADVNQVVYLLRKEND